MSLRYPRFITVTCRGNSYPAIGNQNSRPEQAAVTIHDTWLCGKIVGTVCSEYYRGADKIQRAEEIAKKRCRELNEKHGHV